MCQGRASLILDPRLDDHVETVQLHDAEGFAGLLEIRIQYTCVPDAGIAPLLKNQYNKFDPKDETREMLKALNMKSVGKAKAALGYKPKYPIMIIPGFASSALECWQGDKSQWFRERIWLDPFKIGSTVVGATLANVMNRDSKKLDVQQRKWLRYLLPEADGWSDPEGIKIRPIPGLHGTDFLVDNALAKSASYVNGHIIEQLGHVGYDSGNLDAATYDWRIPPQKLQERDGYYSQLKSKIEFMREQNKERVVLMAHSMGNRCTQYFLTWVNENHPGWTDKNVHAFLALGPPFLGASKSVRAVITGDCCGLDAFLTLEEGRAVNRGLGSVPWLLPIREEYFPDVIARLRIGKRDVPKASSSLLSRVRNSSKKKSRGSLQTIHTVDLEEHDTDSILKLDAPVRSLAFTLPLILIHS